MRSNRKNWVVFFTAIAATSLMGSAVLSSTGVNDEALRFVLRLTARCAFLALLLVFVARPLQQLFRTPFTATLLRQRRLVGITFAGIHTAHLGFVFYRARVIDTFEFSVATNLSGAFTYLVILLMFATSFNATAKLLGPRSWRILHKFGLYWLFASFTLTQLPESLQHLDELGTFNWALLVLVAIALVVRLTAYFAQQQRRASA